LIHLIDQAANLFELRRGDVFGQAPADEFVHRGAQVKDLDGLMDRNIAHENAAVLFGAHQARFFEHSKRLAQRTARHTQPRSECHLGEFDAGREFAGQDHPLELALNDARQRARLQERDRWMSNWDPSVDGYVARSPEGMRAGLGAARRSARENLEAHG
jgi:hypothetical protein